MPDQADIDLLASAELQRLQRQLELRTLMQDKTKQLRKEHHIISMLQREHRTLKDDIETIEGGPHVRDNAKKEKRLARMQKQSAKLQQQLQDKRVSLWGLEAHIKKIEKEIASLRRQEVPDNTYKDTLHRGRRNVVKLENRLDVANKRCSDVLTENRKLRDSINRMLKDRASFNVTWQSMVTQYSEGKKYITDLIDQSTAAYDQREELCNKLQALSDRHENDKLVHLQEVREMQRRLEHEAKLQQFYEIKCQKRLNPELERRETDKRLAQKDVFERQLAEYGGIIEQMKKLYDEADTNLLAARFKRQEEETFALFNYVNELGHEVETLHAATQELADKIERQRNELAEKEEKRKTASLDYLTGQLKDVENQAQEARESRNAVNTRLQDMLRGINEIFRVLACSGAPILSVLGSKTDLAEHNVKLTIGVIERRINSITQSIHADDLSSRILAKRDRIPKFNIRESAKCKK